MKWVCVGGRRSAAAPPSPSGLPHHPRGYGPSMSLRWYTIVVDCHDIGAQAQWWADVLGWRKVYEAYDEVVIIPPRLADEGPRTTLGTGPSRPRVRVRARGQEREEPPPHRPRPDTSDDRDAEIARLLSMGATRVNVCQTGDDSWDVLADPEGNEFCVLSSRDQ